MLIIFFKNRPFYSFRAPPPPREKKPDESKDLRPSKAVNYCEISSQEDCSQEPRPILKATRGRVLHTLDEAISEDDDVPDIEERPLKTAWEKTKDTNELFR